MLLKLQIAKLFQLYFIIISCLCSQLYSLGYESGIQFYSESLSSLSDYGCSLCYRDTYPSETSSSDIMSCSGAYLFVGALEANTTTFMLGAFGEATIIQNSSVALRVGTEYAYSLMDQYHVSNGVSWFFTPGTKYDFYTSPTRFGFYDPNAAYSSLSWYIDGDDVRYPSTVLEYPNPAILMKYIYNCPAPAQPIIEPEPAPAPSPSPSPPSSYGYGIQYNSVTLSSLSSMGCTKCYEDLYGPTTYTSNITSCAGPYLFVGSRSVTRNNFLLGAFAPTAEVQTSTPYDLPHLYNGVYWYMRPERSFGFLDSMDLQQSLVDIGLSGMRSRLSWSLDTYGGGRAGYYGIYLNRRVKIDKTWKKSVYNCPAPSGPPPLVGVTNISTVQIITGNYTILDNDPIFLSALKRAINESADLLESSLSLDHVTVVARGGASPPYTTTVSYSFLLYRVTAAADMVAKLNDRVMKNDFSIILGYYTGQYLTVQGLFEDALHTPTASPSSRPSRGRDTNKITITLNTAPPTTPPSTISSSPSSLVTISSSPSSSVTISSSPSSSVTPFSSPSTSPSVILLYANSSDHTVGSLGGKSVPVSNSNRNSGISFGAIAGISIAAVFVLFGSLYCIAKLFKAHLKNSIEETNEKFGYCPTETRGVHA